MNDKTKELLKSAYDYCNINGKSTEFMLEYMQYIAKVDLDTVIKYFKEN